MNISISVYLSSICLFISRVRDIWVWLLTLSILSYVTLGGDLAFLNFNLVIFELRAIILFSLKLRSLDQRSDRISVKISVSVFVQLAFFYAWEIIAKHDSRLLGKLEGEPRLNESLGSLNHGEWLHHHPNPS